MTAESNFRFHCYRTPYQEAADMQADARELAALLVSRGATGRELEMDAAWFEHDMAKVIVGEGPEPRIVTSRRWDTHAKYDLVLDDPEANLTSLEFWNRAGRYAIPYYFTVEEREELGLSLMGVRAITVDFSAAALEEFVQLQAGVDDAEPVIEPEADQDHGPDLG
jgi:hypothetical protein